MGAPSPTTAPSDRVGQGSRLDHTRVPSIGLMKPVLMGGSPDEAEAVDAQHHEAVRNELY